MNENKSIDNRKFLYGFFSGIFAGAIEAWVTNPLTVIKFQVQKKQSWILKPWAYYNGVIPNALGIMPITAIQVGITESIKSTVFENQPTVMQQAGAAFVAGAISSGVACSTEMMMLLKNENPKTHLSVLLKEQFKTKGFSGFFVGQLATVLREGPFSVALLVLQPWIKDLLHEQGLNDSTATLVSGSISGVSAAFFTHPFDSIKTKMQLESIYKSPYQKTGLFKTAQGMSLLNFCQGFWARGANTALSIVVMAHVLAWLKKKEADLFQDKDCTVNGGMNLKS